MQDKHLKFNTGLTCQKHRSTKKKSFRQQIGLKFKEETSKLLHFENRLYGA